MSGALRSVFAIDRVGNISSESKRPNARLAAHGRRPRGTNCAWVSQILRTGLPASRPPSRRWKPLNPAGRRRELVLRTSNRFGGPKGPPYILFLPQVPRAASRLPQPGSESKTPKRSTSSNLRRHDSDWNLVPGSGAGNSFLERAIGSANLKVRATYFLAAGAARRMPIAATPIGIQNAQVLD
jgi:hypothetical protein